MKTLHMSIGPVQSFVSQARRTRDLWAGSFLLSYLTGHAMAQVIEMGGSIVFPRVHDPEEKEKPESTISDDLLKKIWEVGKAGPSEKEGPYIGSLPNRFQAEIPDGKSPEPIVDAVNQAWTKVAEAVRKRAFPTGFPSKATEEIWERQVKDFWEITWVIGDKHDLLNRRKHWRTHIPPDEPGDKCTLTGNLQELSGFIRAHHRKEQDDFWKQVRQGLSSFDLQENERLSAIALIKRIYPQVARQALGWELPNVAQNFPSTAFLAAMPWILSKGDTEPEQAQNFAQLAKKAGIMKSEGVGIPSTAVDSSFYKLEGSVFFSSNLKRDNYWEEQGKKEAFKKELIDALSILTKEEKDEPSPFYALLLMDGDRMGELLAIHKEKVSEALGDFTKNVSRIVQDHQGFTVYAGGDDVLALLPLKQGLPAVVSLQEQYKEAFSKIDAIGEISAGLVYAHYKAPLQSVLKSAHQLLDDVAKTDCGRDSLAIRVWKGGGPLWTWSCPWNKVLSSTKPPETHMERVANQIRGQEAYSSSFFYHLRSRIELLTPDSKAEMDDFSEEVIKKLMVAEYMGGDRDVSREQAEEQMEALLPICLDYQRDEKKEIETGRFQIEGALIARFLATEGREQG
ncbi:type III-B CRISPR-associated protein Cas10/Cmr2 [Kroppenstedtia pulmonis]|uniref:Type III-B CRISPR-associated protein Cas10/Cmr2 n=1 Tax=Kroppenstedtia pulmonis TaxID=1380685 RepID=A0A7D4CUI1_9BACL|nr:type III-B CRISPR-associated protein Cas10/Cmr2 [Kroppenstedtia pulmonis]QKG83297.1 type III-B CRISPR-associated protein Cas10/Cmr2 [Kroppenstedtia pulmonis]